MCFNLLFDKSTFRIFSFCACPQGDFTTFLKSVQLQEAGNVNSVMFKGKNWIPLKSLAEKGSLGCCLQAKIRSLRKTLKGESD